MVCQILNNLLNRKQVHYVNTIISWWQQVCGIKKKRMKLFFENSNNFDMSSVFIMVDVWSSGWERESCKQ